MSDNHKRDLYEQIGENPLTWWSSARTLFLVAEKLSKDIEKSFKEPLEYHYTSIKVCMFLYGLGIENIIKGLLIKQKRYPFKNGKFPKELKTHDLRKLFDNANIKMTERDIKLLNRLTEYIKWVGKYGIPLSYDKLKNWHTIPKSTFLSDIHHIKNIIKTLDTKRND